MTPYLTFRAVRPTCSQCPGPGAALALGRCAPQSSGPRVHPPAPHRAPGTDRSSPGAGEGAGQGRGLSPRPPPSPRARLHRVQRAGLEGRGLGRDRSAAAGAAAGGEGEGGASPEACAQTAGRRTDARRERAGGEVSIRWERGRRAEGRRRGQPGTRGRGRGGRRRARGRLRSGVGPKTLPWPVGRAAPESAAPAPFSLRLFSFQSAKINTREGKTIAGPPGTRRARSFHVWGGGRSWHREWRPHVGASSRCVPAKGGVPRGAGLGRRRREFPGVRRVGKVLLEQSGFPHLLWAGKLRRGPV